MSLSVTTLANNVAAYSPVLLEGVSTRTPFVSGVRRSTSVTAVSDAGGHAKFAVISSTGFEVDDTILISGGTIDYAVYNGLQRVTVIAAGYITVDFAYTSVASGATPTIYKQNNALYVKAEIVDAGTSAVLETLYTPVLTDGTFSVDVSRSLQSTFGSIFSQTAGDVSTGELFSKAYDIEVYEVWQSNIYTTNQEHDVSETQSTIAHRTTLYSSAYVSGTSLLNDNFFAKTHALIHFMTDQTSDVHVVTDPYTNGSSGIGVDHLIEGTYTNGHCALVVNVPSTCDYLLVTILWDNGSTIDPIKDVFYIYNVKNCTATVLYYLNRLGGYEGYGFTSYIDSQQVERVDKYKALTWKERTLIGREYPNALYQDVRDLITSPEVYDEDGILVEVLNDGLQYRDEQVIPQVTVKYKETHIQ